MLGLTSADHRWDWHRRIADSLPEDKEKRLVDTLYVLTNAFLKKSTRKDAPTSGCADIREEARPTHQAQHYYFLFIIYFVLEAI